MTNDDSGVIGGDQRSKAMGIDEFYDSAAIFDPIERRDIHVLENCRRSCVVDNPLAIGKRGTPNAERRMQNAARTALSGSGYDQLFFLLLDFLLQIRRKISGVLLLQLGFLPVFAG